MPWPDSPRNRATGPGSRGGSWHEQEFRRAYHRAWRRANPEYRERERLRRRVERGQDPARPTKTLAQLPVAVAPCFCPECKCDNPVPVVACGMCLMGLHEEAGS